MKGAAFIVLLAVVAFALEVLDRCSTDSKGHPMRLRETARGGGEGGGGDRRCALRGAESQARASGAGGGRR
jgi:hypothetical protein